MKKFMLILTVLSSALVHTAFAKVTIEDGYKSESSYYESVKKNQAEYEKDLYEGLKDPQNGASTP
ncbi:hypothetical protein, partial [Vibrio echinoideorum]